MIIEFDIPDVPAPTDPFVGYWGKQVFVGHFSEDPFVVSLASRMCAVFSLPAKITSPPRSTCAAFGSRR